MEGLKSKLEIPLHLVRLRFPAIQFVVYFTSFLYKFNQIPAVVCTLNLMSAFER